MDYILTGLRPDNPMQAALGDLLGQALGVEAQGGDVESSFEKDLKTVPLSRRHSPLKAALTFSSTAAGASPASTTTPNFRSKIDWACSVALAALGCDATRALRRREWVEAGVRDQRRRGPDLISGCISKPCFSLTNPSAIHFLTNSYL